MFVRREFILSTTGLVINYGVIMGLLNIKHMIDPNTTSEGAAISRKNCLDSS